MFQARQQNRLDWCDFTLRCEQADCDIISGDDTKINRGCFSAHFQNGNPPAMQSRQSLDCTVIMFASVFR